VLITSSLNCEQLFAVTGGGSCHQDFGLVVQEIITADLTRAAEAPAKLKFLEYDLVWYKLCEYIPYLYDTRRRRLKNVGQDHLDVLLPVVRRLIVCLCSCGSRGSTYDWQSLAPCLDFLGELALVLLSHGELSPSLMHRLIYLGHDDMSIDSATA
jgi:hypothetical protein